MADILASSLAPAAVALVRRSKAQRVQYLVGRVGWRPETPPIASAARLKGPEVSAGAGIARASETPAAVSRNLPLIARIYRPRRQAGRAQQIRFEHRTKTEHRATILLPNPVAAADTKRHATDRPLKIRRQINTS